MKTVRELGEAAVVGHLINKFTGGGIVSMWQFGTEELS